MVALTSLLLPIAVAAVLVFLVSSILHMVVPLHTNDFKRLPDEDAVMTALRAARVPPGDYFLPRPENMKDCRTPEFQKKLSEGPVAFMTVFANGCQMGKSLALWFVYCLVVGLFAGYVASRTLAPGAEYLAIFRVTGTVAFCGYALALWQNTIWGKRTPISTIKYNFDGLLYALCTAGAFGWLWPAAAV